MDQRKCRSHQPRGFAALQSSTATNHPCHIITLISFGPGYMSVLVENQCTTVINIELYKANHCLFVFYTFKQHTLIRVPVPIKLSQHIIPSNCY